jgi:fused
MALVNMVKPMTNIADPVQLACIHVLSVLVNPVYGDIFSFPWNRGPHDGINEYLEAVSLFEDARKILSNAILDFDLLKCLLTAFHSEDESHHIETKIAVIRIVS